MSLGNNTNYYALRLFMDWKVANYREEYAPDEGQKNGFGRKSRE
jgi:hypothetical protein